MYYCRNACASRSVVQSLIGSVCMYQCVVHKQLKTIVANKSNEQVTKPLVSAPLFHH